MYITRYLMNNSMNWRLTIGDIRRPARDESRNKIGANIDAMTRY